MAKEAKATLQTEKLEAVADRGYFSSEEILTCEQAGITVTLPKPMTSGSKAEAASASRTSATWPRRTSISVRPAKGSTYRYTTEENGLVLRRYWTNACQSCAIKQQLHHRQGATDHPMGA